MYLLWICSTLIYLSSYLLKCGTFQRYIILTCQLYRPFKWSDNRFNRHEFTDKLICTTNVHTFCIRFALLLLHNLQLKRQKLEAGGKTHGWSSMSASLHITHSQQARKTAANRLYPSCRTQRDWFITRAVTPIATDFLSPLPSQSQSYLAIFIPKAKRLLGRAKAEVYIQVVSRLLP